EAAASGLVSVQDAFGAGNISAGRKIRTGHHLHIFLERRARFVDSLLGAGKFPPVGKSGPGTTFIISLSGVSGLSISITVASIISPRLCGGMFVAMPTAM